MNDPSQGSELLAGLADEFAARFRRGERPALTEYADRYPELAAQIRDLFPALVVMEQFGSIGGATGPLPATADVRDVPRQLGDFRVVREVGRGGMGVVYEAVQESLGRHVALKVLPYHRLLHESQLERFRREARAAARLHHSNIVPVFGVGEVAGVHYYAMQFIHGQSLDGVLHEMRRLRGKGGRPPQGEARRNLALASTLADRLRTGRFPDQEPGATERQDDPAPHAADSADLALTVGSRAESAALSDLAALSGTQYFHGVARIGVQVAEALHYAHQQGVLHRDIKPSNLLLDTHGAAWITDFGLAKAGEADGLTVQGDVVGTLRYMAPERFRGESDPRGDVYSLGLTLYELVTLRPAFAASERAALIDRIRHAEPARPRKLQPNAPRDLETIILKAIAREPARRYPTAGALAEDLRRFLDGRAILARRSSASEQVWRWCRRNPAVAGLLATVITLLVTIAVGASVSAARLTQHLRRAEAAEHNAMKNLWGSYLAQARANRYSGRPGRRFEGLETLARAARLGVFPERRSELRDEAIACLALADLRPVRMLAGRSIDEYRVAFDPMLDRYAISDADCNVSLRRVADDVEIAVLPCVSRLPRGSWIALRFSPEGQRLAIGYDFDCDGRESSVHVWDVRGGRPARTLALAYASLFDFSPDGRRLAVGRSDGTISLLDAGSGQELAHFETGFPAPHQHFQLAFRPDGRQVAINSRTSRAVHVVDVESGALVARLEHPATTHKFVWRGDGRRLAVGCDDLRIYLWDPAEPRQPLARLEGHERKGISLAYTHGGDLLISTAWDDTSRLWDAERSRPLLRELTGNFLAFGADDRSMILRRSSRLELWELVKGREYRVLPHAADSVDFSADGAVLVSAGQGVVCWDAAEGRELARLPAGPNAVAAFRPVGLELATFGQETGLLLWPAGAARGGSFDPHRLGSPTLLKRPEGDGSERACWSADGRLLAVLDGAKGEVVIMDGQSGTERNRLRLYPTSPPQAQSPPGSEAAAQDPLSGHLAIGTLRVRLALSPEGRWAAAGLPGAVTVWDVATGRASLLPGSTPGNHVAFSPDGRWLVVGGVGDYRFYRVGSWQAGPVLFRDVGESAPGPMAFARDGRVLAIARTLSDVQLLDLTTGLALATLQAPEPRQVSWLCFSPEGDRLAVATPGDHIRLWDLGLIRRQLTALGLDWDERSHAPAAPGPPGHRGE